MAHRFTPEQKAFLKEHVKGRSNKELTEMFNNRFSLQLKVAHIQNYKGKNGLRSELLSGSERTYTDEQIAFLRENVKGRSLKELTEMFNARFGLNKSTDQISNTKNRYGLKSGITGGQFEKSHEPWNKGLKGICTGGKETQFKKGQRPLNYRPVGSERITDDYVMVKVADPRTWKMKHVVVWEKENGPVPKGYTVIFGDKNRRNFELNNLILVSREQLARLNQNHLIADDAELTKTGLIIADIYSKIGKRKKAAKSKGNR